MLKYKLRYADNIWGFLEMRRPQHNHNHNWIAYFFSW